MSETATVLSEVTETAPQRELNRYHDRCHCGAQGFMVARKERPEAAPHEHVDSPTHYELVFCGHHGKKAQPGLVAKGWDVLDFLHMLNEKPSISANAE